MILSSRYRIYRRYRKHMFYVAGGTSVAFIIYQIYYYLLLMKFQNRGSFESTTTTTPFESEIHRLLPPNTDNKKQELSSSNIIIGADPELQYRYRRKRKSGHFRCLTSSERIAWDLVNDDYCDCSDGSDEPSTSACSAIVSDLAFHCPQTSCTTGPKTIPFHRVNDGICDCCDGSDEIHHRDRTSNRFRTDLRHYTIDRRTSVNQCFFRILNR